MNFLFYLIKTIFKKFNMNEQLGISGKWMDKRTGQIINVRDSIIDGDMMIVISDHGQIDMTEFSQFYIQTSDEIYNEQGQIIDNKPANVSEIYNTESYYPSVNNIETTNFNNEVLPQPNTIVSDSKPVINNFDLIDKLFKKKNYEPVIKIDIDKNGCPINELKMLMDIYDIQVSDISKYLVYEYIKPEYIQAAVGDFIEQLLNKNSD